MRILFIGDIVGRPGRQALRQHLDSLVDTHLVDMVVANGENAAGGFGLTHEISRELFDLGVQVITTGNHIWDKKESLDSLLAEERILRPANYPEGVAGRGAKVYSSPGGVRLGVINLEGRVFMANLDCPFRVADRLVEELRRHTPLILVDFHAEATSEKIALGHYLAGRVSAVFGTHTHVQTADERILAGGTAFITDVGMTGSQDSVIGIRKEIAIEKFLKQVPMRFEIAKKDPVLSAVLLDIDEDSGRAHSIERVFLRC
ncbi:TIGR00282 family metallophosphoesterase [Geoalkalibacter halelectricus]|uniref:TIGR00282 family metallophosphoesterase n=1 Tax=Geoalkalibacter halelectricus TaxID=2847045 RepID=A0ABY5ZP80_9BACT|nr:TIGR00282 family metallophosphoesterase [Geoalkalibacter halelectricus]UWZ80957.1 TIGR00282 family metallophosphoesterase [Geoalkalibacter halelectricus]